MERKIEVSKSKCIHCGRCVRNCFVSCLKFHVSIPKVLMMSVAAVVIMFGA